MTNKQLPLEWKDKIGKNKFKLKITTQNVKIKLRLTAALVIFSMVSNILGEEWIRCQHYFLERLQI